MDKPPARPEDTLIIEIEELTALLKAHFSGYVDFPDIDWARLPEESRMAHLRRVHQNLTVRVQDFRVWVQITLHKIKATESERNELQNQYYSSDENESWEDRNNEHKRVEPDEGSEGTSTDDFDEEF